MVRTEPSQGLNRGSTPRRVTDWCEAEGGWQKNRMGFCFFWSRKTEGAKATESGSRARSAVRDLWPNLPVGSHKNKSALNGAFIFMWRPEHGSARRGSGIFQQKNMRDHQSECVKRLDCSSLFRFCESRAMFLFLQSKRQKPRAVVKHIFRQENDGWHQKIRHFSAEKYPWPQEQKSEKLLLQSTQKYVKVANVDG